MTLLELTVVSTESIDHFQLKNKERNALSDTVCHDSNSFCHYWASTLNECEDNASFMLRNCRRSCGQCPRSVAEKIDGIVEKIDGMAEKIDRIDEKIDGMTQQEGHFGTAPAHATPTPQSSTPPAFHAPKQTPATGWQSWPSQNTWKTPRRPGRHRRPR